MSADLCTLSATELVDLYGRHAASPVEVTMAPQRTVLKDGCVLSVDRNVGNFRQADVLIEGSKIAAVGPHLGAAPPELADQGDRPRRRPRSRARCDP